MLAPMEITNPPIERHLILIEVAAFAALAVATKLALNPIMWRFSGPVSLVITLAILTIYLRRSSMDWRQFGLSTPGGKRVWLWLPLKILATAFAILAAGVTVGLTLEHFGPAWLSEIPETVGERWGNLEGNLPLYLLWMSLAWTTAAFGEEMFFRGYLVGRLEMAFSNRRLGTALAIFLPALFFGISHMYYQGPRGLFVTGTIALVLGTLFVVYKRNLWPLIIAHGLIDSLVFTAHFMNWDI